MTVPPPSGGRRTDAPSVTSKPEQRTPEEQDIDRLFYTYYFRRLAEITQVAAYDERNDKGLQLGLGALQHNRLTHSLKVGQVAGRMAQYLQADPKNAAGIAAAGGLNHLVAEFAGRAHDLGHPPYGHIGEDVLDQVAREQGLSDGFEGNAQTFRILSALIRRVSEGQLKTGLGVTDRALAACVKYPWGRQAAGKKFRKFGYIALDQGSFDDWVRPLLKDSTDLDAEDKPFKVPLLEADIMDWADDVSYATHDLEDYALDGSIPLSLLRHEVSGTGPQADYRPVAPEEYRAFWHYASTRLQGRLEVSLAEAERTFQEAAANFPRRAATGNREDAAYMGRLSSDLIEDATNAAYITSAGQLKVRPEKRAQIEILKQLTWYYVIDTPRLVAAQRGQPLLLILDDLHWADPASIDLLITLALKVQGPITIVLAYREDDTRSRAFGNGGHPIRRRPPSERRTLLKHKHYLSGSLYCDRCGSRLLFGISTGRTGQRYEYFFCAGRHAGRTNCDLPHLPLEQVEDAVAAQWDREVFPSDLVAALRQQLTNELRTYNATAESERRRLSERIAAVRRERYKWAEKAMEGVVPADIARERQAQLADQLLAAESALSRLSSDQDSHEATLNAVLDLVDSCGQAYRLSSAKGRRDYNQAFFEALQLDSEEDEQRPTVAKVTRTPLLAALHEHRSDNLQDVVDQEQQRRRGVDPDGVDCVSVSNYELVVGDEGLEPPTLSV